MAAVAAEAEAAAVTETVERRAARAAFASGPRVVSARLLLDLVEVLVGNSVRTRSRRIAGRGLGCGPRIADRLRVGLRLRPISLCSHANLR